MKILGVVVLYHPDSSVWANIDGFIEQIDMLMAWDNTPEETRHPLGYKNTDKIIFRGEGKNMGIGYALNRAAEYALENDYTHLLTLDQDSSFDKDTFASYLDAVKKHGGQEAIFSTNYFLVSSQKPQYPVTDTVDEVNSCMTSGTIYPVSLFRKLGLFREDLFVWGVDCEYSWRVQRAGIPTLCFKNILLTHSLGYQQKRRKLLGRAVFPNEYGPARSYYNVRNGIILHREYPRNISLRAHLKYHLYKRIVFILLYERQKTAKLKALYLGWRHGNKGVTGQCKKDLLCETIDLNRRYVFLFCIYLKEKFLYYGPDQLF